MADWISKRHDTKRVLETNIGPAGLLTDRLAATLADPATVVSCIVKAANADGQTPSSGTPKVNSPAEIVDAPSGHLRYSPVTADVDTSGTYLVEWEVVGPDGKPDTYPTDGYDTWLIVDDLDNAS